MPLLGPDDPLPATPRRVVVAGPSGAGKTTLAGEVARRLGLEHVEIDGLFHGPGWTPWSTFVDDVYTFTAGDRWVTEWQYAAVRDRLTERAELFVWLDLPRQLVMRQVVRRTVVRRVRRRELWNGNQEGPLWTFFTDREHIVRWAWRTHGLYPDRVAAVQRRRPELPVVRLRSRSEVEDWLAGPLSDVATSRD